MQREQEAGLLAELLCARLCHDLAGAVGAVTAGAELLAEEGAGNLGAGNLQAGEALDLMAASAASLTARLRYLRLALGPCNQSAVTQARGLAEALFSKGYPQGEWQLDWPADQVAVSPDQAKLLLNLICLAQESLPRGGVIAVRLGSEVSVAARGATAVLGEAAQGLTQACSFEVGPRAAQGVYAALLASRLGVTITVHQAAGAVIFTA